MMVGTSPKNSNIALSITGKVDVVANTSSRKAYYCSILIEEVGHLPMRISYGFTSVVIPYDFCVPEVRSLLDVLDINPV